MARVAQKTTPWKRRTRSAPVVEEPAPAGTPDPLKLTRSGVPRLQKRMVSLTNMQIEALMTEAQRHGITLNDMLRRALDGWRDSLSR